MADITGMWVCADNASVERKKNKFSKSERFLLTFIQMCAKLNVRRNG